MVAAVANLTAVRILKKLLAAPGSSAATVLASSKEGTNTPCDTVALSEVSFSLENTNIDLLSEAMKNLWYSSPIVSSTGVVTWYRGSERVTLENGKLTCVFPQDRTDEKTYVNCIKRAYSDAVVRHVAKRNGWKLKEKTPGKFVVQKGN